MRKINKKEIKETVYSLSQINKRKLREFTPKFWDRLNEFIDSDKPDERKFAVQEFNKIVLKLMPTQISGIDGDSLVKLSLVNYGDKDSIQLQAKTLSAPVVESDGHRVQEGSGDMA